MPEPRWRLVARAIIEAGRPLSSLEIADALGILPHLPRQRRQARVNAIFLEDQTCHREPSLRLAGYGHGSYNNVRYNLWDVTDAGRTVMEEPWVGKPKVAIRKEAIAARRAARLARLEALPALAAERGWGPHTGPREREVAARELRPMGLSLQDIASVFGVTREQIRLDLLPPERREVIRKGNIERNRRYARRHYAAHREEILARNRKRKEQAKVRVRAPKGRRRLIFRSGMLADMDTVTFTEW